MYLYTPHVSYGVATAYIRHIRASTSRAFLLSLAISLYICFAELIFDMASFGKPQLSHLKKLIVNNTYNFALNYINYLSIIN